MNLNYLAPGLVRLSGKEEDYVRFSMDHQLLDRQTWRNFVEVFRSDSDIDDLGWRCEYWGKMMRGACLTYMHTGDKELYAVLDETVRDLLTAQREDGRFSTYPADNDLKGWDIWGRKYVITGFLHFYRICKDEALKAQILEALYRHADALIREVGPGEGQTRITYTSDWWEGVNSSSVLETIVDLYKLTGCQKYLDFASYIVSEGGCRKADLIKLAYEGKLMPYEYPEVKAYETMSFFEGVLAYYEVTGGKYYLDAVLRFIDAVAKTDVTLIGSSGCTHELFDHSSVKQTEWSDIIMQETCVTVTWMRLMARLHLFTGDRKYVDWMECSAYNALYGAVNTGLEKQFCAVNQLWVDPMPFDSYSPLYDNQRGVGIGGYKEFAFGGYYGCCACIASAGTALFPLCSVIKTDDGLVINEPLGGTVSFTVPGASADELPGDQAINGQTVTLTMTSSFPEKLQWQGRLTGSTCCKFTLRIRVPFWAENVCLTVNGEKVTALENGYLTVTRCWNDGDEITFTGDTALRTVSLNGRTAFLWGPLVLARDVQKEPGLPLLSDFVSLKADPQQKLSYRLLSPAEGEVVRLEVEKADGTWMLLTDYASCGKHWREENCRISPWLNVTF